MEHYKLVMCKRFMVVLQTPARVHTEVGCLWQPQRGCHPIAQGWRGSVYPGYLLRGDTTLKGLQRVNGWRIASTPSGLSRWLGEDPR